MILYNVLWTLTNLQLLLGFANALPSDNWGVMSDTVPQYQYLLSLAYIIIASQYYITIVQYTCMHLVYFTGINIIRIRDGQPVIVYYQSRLLETNTYYMSSQFSYIYLDSQHYDRLLLVQIIYNLRNIFLLFSVWTLYVWTLFCLTSRHLNANQFFSFLISSEPICSCLLVLQCPGQLHQSRALPTSHTM